MKKIITTPTHLALTVSVFMLTAAPAAAQSFFDNVLGGTKRTVGKALGTDQELPSSGNPYLDTIIVLINTLTTFLAIVFFFILLYAGYLWMFARGNDEQVNRAKRITREVIIGIIIIVLARIITEFILGQVSQAVEGAN